MKILVFLIVVVTISAFDVPDTADREHEPNPKEYKPFQMTQLIRNFCTNVKRIMDSTTQRPRNAMELSHLVIAQFDKSHNRCISNDEIRDIAARFRGDLTGYRTLFQHVLDENRNGCVEADELNAIILDCVMPSATWMKTYPGKYEIPFDDEVRHRELIKEIQPAEDNTVEEEQEVADPEQNVDPELAEREDAERRQMLEAEKARKLADAGLNPAIREMICSMVRRETEDAVVGINMIAEIVDADDNNILSFNEFSEFLAGARIPKEESDDIARIIDADKDGVLLPGEIVAAVDGCPIPQIEPAPIVNTRPMIAKDDVTCPSPRAMYGYLRKVAMKFVGTQPLRFEDVREAAAKMFVLITGDLEKTIEPKDLDIPLDCVKETWSDVDRNRDGFLDLYEFQNIAHDVLEEFIPRRVKKLRKTENTRLNMDKVQETPLRQEAPRDHLEILHHAAYQTLRDLGKRLPESDLQLIANRLYNDKSVREFLVKIDGRPNAEASDKLMNLVRPKVIEAIRREE